MFNKWASQHQQKKTKTKKKKKEPQSFNCTCTVYLFLFLSNINRLVFNAIGLCDLYIKHSYDFNSVLIMLRQQL